MKTVLSSSHRLLLPVLLITCMSVDGHHASKFFQVSEPHWVSGTVIEFRYMNPHSRILLSVPDENGSLREWIIEGPRLDRMHRIGVKADFLDAGDSIQVCGFIPTEELIQLSRENNGIAQQDTFMHGRLLVKPDAERWLWGPYGDLETCLPRQEWQSINRGELPLPVI